MVLCLHKEYQYSQGYSIIFTAWAQPGATGFPTVPAWFPNSEPGPGSAGLSLRSHKFTMAPESYGYCFDVGTTPTTQTYQYYTVGLTAPMYGTCVSGCKRTPSMGKQTPYPPPGTHIAQPLDPHRLLHSETVTASAKWSRESDNQLAVCMQVGISALFCLVLLHYQYW